MQRTRRYLQMRSHLPPRVHWQSAIQAAGATPPWPFTDPDGRSARAPARRGGGKRHLKLSCNPGWANLLRTAPVRGDARLVANYAQPVASQRAALPRSVRVKCPRLNILNCGSYRRV
jgi:hypothetical protein